MQGVESFAIGFEVARSQQRCLSTIESLKLVKRIVTDLFEIVESEGLDSLRGQISQANELTSEFNNDLALRFLLWKNGYNSKQLPSLYNAEKLSVELLTIYFNKKLRITEAIPGDWSGTFKSYME
jgi:hypothetical protein